MKMSEKDRLLNDLVRDESYLAFRTNLLGRLRAGLRQKRTSGTRRKLLALAACIPLALGIFLIMSGRPRPLPSRSGTLSIVRTVPLPPDRIVTTATAKMQSTSLSTEIVFVTNARSEIEIVQTGSSPTQTLSDEQLLDLFKGRPVALVFVAPNERRLVVIDEDQKAGAPLPNQ